MVLIDYTRDAVVGSFQVRLEVFGARLSDRVHRGDKQRTVLSAGAESVHVLRDVTASAHVFRDVTESVHVLRDVAVAAECLLVVGRDTAPSSHAAVQRAADDDDVVGVTARREPLVNAVLTCL